ncbi:MAG: hypothetical protein QG602_1289 [Verrucomicrobiota bacterium]|nr:hypothetical protein [Verrucomicrobiota bacterium]
MKPVRTLLLALGLVAVLRSADAESMPVSPSSTNVVVQASVSELAAGYAAAISQMSLKGLVIYFQGDGKVVALKGIRSARALNGVLLVAFSAGDMLAINVERIVLISDGTRTPQG